MIERCLRSLLSQDIPPVRVIVNVPLKYRRFKETPDLALLQQYSRISSKIVIHRGQDYGPGTKLLGGLEYLAPLNLPEAYIVGLRQFPETHIIAVDDDTEYAPDLATVIMETARDHPGQAVSRHVYQLPFHTMGSVGFEVGKGCNGFCFPLTDRLLHPRTGIRAFFEVVNHHKRVFLDDDVWFSFFLMLSGHDIVQTANQGGREITYNDTDALSRISTFQQLEIVTDICKIRESVSRLVEMRENSELYDFEYDTIEVSTQKYQGERAGPILLIGLVCAWIAWQFI
jgi:hypothetical protein